MSEFKINLPTKPQTAKRTNARRMLVVGSSKIGKTSALMQLPNCLVIDLESGASSYDGMSVNIQEIAMKLSKEQDIPIMEAKLQAYFETIQAIRESDHVYDYIVVDNTTRLEDMAAYYATLLYKKSTIGKNFKGDDVVTELEKGSGYGWLRIAFIDRLIEAIEGLAAICTIYVGHVKKSSITKNDVSITAQDLELTGKIKTLLVSDMCATGFLRREKSTNKNILSFKTSESDLLTGARIPHLAGKEFLLSEVSEDGTLVTYWDNIFLKN